MGTLLAVSRPLDRFLERIADASGWLLLVLMAVTCVDVTLRKFGVAAFPFTKAQELEWHLHTVIFAMWLGFNYVINAHPRVDSYTERLEFRTRAWFELVCLLVFALPFTLMLLWYGWDFVRISWNLNERSESLLGLPYRWVIKGILYFGLWLVLVAVVSVLLRLIAFLFGGRPNEEAKLRIGHSASQV